MLLQSTPAVLALIFKDQNEGHCHIKQLENEASCNAVLNLDFESETFSSANYKYTIDAFKGDFALVLERLHL
ncbi:hypothetical protein CXF83_05755 [Shewanella sp. Choline-02u-19]|uniref:hypothetical protein n=1 Tax=unclassified Shewanella TaxID=196818 RepID=UPI000C3425F2|nr:MULTISPECIES: hypothetical protein [unclassified Shewanella]PKH56594.1 hypothetical protein CXF84_11775 [Shewanella sp. Bg11-22]PKI30145.1 hypothetical protein CXF83_05755 [Shewanella sp. Choline-02u-19]